jgi:hypothetical protein
MIYASIIFLPIEFFTAQRFIEAMQFSAFDRLAIMPFQTVAQSKCPDQLVGVTLYSSTI